MNVPSVPWFPHFGRHRKPSTSRVAMEFHPGSPGGERRAQETAARTPKPLPERQRRRPVVFMNFGGAQAHGDRRGVRNQPPGIPQQDCISEFPVVALGP